MTTLEKVQDIIANQLGKDKSEIKPETNLSTDLKADSLEVAEMLFMFEEEFGVTLEENDALNLKTVSDIVALVDRLSK